MCVSESYFKFFASHPIGCMLNRDQRTTITFDSRERNEKGYGDERQCFCAKNTTKNSNVTNILETTKKCDKTPTMLTKTRRDTGYRNLSQFKLSK